MDEIRGVVAHILFSSPDRMFCVFRIKEESGNRGITAAGQVETPYIGETITIRGSWQRHPRFGMQFRAEVMKRIKPSESEGIRAFLASGTIDGIGPATAARIVDRFGSRTLELMDENIDILREIPGIGKKTLEKIRASYESTASLHEMVLFLQSVGISGQYASAIHKTYGEAAEAVLENDPYRMIGEVQGLGFQAADRIALAKGILNDDEDRIEHGIFYILSEFAQKGHSCAPVSAVYRYTAALLRVDEDIIAAAGNRMTEDGIIPSSDYKNVRYAYLPALYEAETESALYVAKISGQVKSAESSTNLAIEKFEREKGIRLAERQRDAVIHSMSSGMLIITGGPGTGKTTLIKAIIFAAEQAGQSVMLMAPTGRAAKRLAISSERNAETIHKALEAELHDDGVFFAKNENNPLRADTVIVDEASMLDITLFYRLLCALKEGSRLILAGDVDQLPPVGAGYPLKDLIDSAQIPVVELQHIFRQESGSSIVENAYRIHDGRRPVADAKGESVIYEVNGEEEARQTILRLCREMHYEDNEKKMSMQILSPVHKGICGVNSLNRSIQQFARRREETGSLPYAEGDKVMQRVNNYEKDVYNGDIGLVWAATEKKLFVRFPDKEVIYEREEWNDLQLAYVITVHKSQGSEYDTVILVLLPSQTIMLQRNLFYTAVTRARKRIIIVGTAGALEKAVRNNYIAGRTSLFLPRLTGEMSE